MDAPAKPWRVAVPQFGSSDHRLRDDAYFVAREWQDHGHWVVVRQWQDGKWVLVEKLKPLAQDSVEEG